MLPVVDDANDLGAVIFGSDVIMGEDVPHFSAAWWLSVGATVLPVLPGKVARAAVGLGAEGGSKLASEAAENSPDGLKYMARGMKNEKRVLEGLGYVKNTKTFTAVNHSGPYNTIPDIVDASNKMVGEIKDVQRLEWTKQLRAQFAVAEEMGYRYVLFIRSETVLRGDLAEAVHKRRVIEVEYIDDYILHR